MLAEDGSVELSLAEVHTFCLMSVYIKKQTKLFTERGKKKKSVDSEAMLLPPSTKLRKGEKEISSK